MTTPHISAADGAFAETILLPGDPLRAKWIAETFLTDVEEVTAVRNILGFTGSYQGERLSVMGTGMGVPSISIYATELINSYGCKNLIRVGSCGGLQPDLELGSVVVAMGACTDSGVNRARFQGYDFAATADYGLLSAVVDAAIQSGSQVHVGNVMTADLFYAPGATGPVLDDYAYLIRMGVLAIEMEIAGLYGVAAELGAAAVGLCTVSDNLIKEQYMSSEERETGLRSMIEVVLQAVT
jgi:purine-nucleoside phosphorylase